MGVFRGQAPSRPDVVEAREAFVQGQSELDPAKLIFIDEAGVSIAMSRHYGWAPKGERPVIERPAKGRRLTLMGAIALDGPRALRQVEGFVDGEEFQRFLREDLGLNLNPGDIVVMDGPSIHRVAGVAEVLAERGATALYLPAYSPELNPIELAWAWIKGILRAIPPRRLKVLKERAAKLWGMVTARLCEGWVRHCGYAVST